MGFFDVIGKAFETIARPVGKFFQSPGEHLRDAGLWALGKAKTVTNFLKKGKDFLSEVPIVGDAINASKVGQMVDTADKTVNQVDKGANWLNQKYENYKKR